MVRKALLLRGGFLLTSILLFTFLKTNGVIANLCQGDINNDGKVNGGDLLMLKAEMGRDDCYSSFCEADLNGDGKIDSQDTEILKAEHGRSDCLASKEGKLEEIVDIVEQEQDEAVDMSEDEAREVMITSSEVEKESVEGEAELPVTRFVDNGDGTVTDPETGFMWMKDANLPDDTMLFHQALTYITKLNKGEYANCGYTDWKLPTFNELRSLIDFTKYTRWGHVPPEGHPFENVQSLRFYDRSSPTYLTKPDHAWLVYCYCRLVGHNAKPCYGFVWPVRDVE